ncbi:MAG: ATP-binding protein [Methanosarcinaceae archaeon]|nr:ATP-binding protein [Methanosarcinaceae archaeon]
MERMPIHAMIYGDSGVGKSTFASSFPKPMLVFCFDPHGKDIPYWRGVTAPLQEYAIGNAVVKYRDCAAPDGFVRIEYYHDIDTDNPTAIRLFRERMGLFQNEYASWKTICLDSVTMMELCARKYEEKIMNPGPVGVSKFVKGSGVDTRQWFAGSTDALEEIIIQRFGALPMNVVVLCHINERKNEISGEILRGANAPGRLATRGLLNAAYQEQYYVSTMRDTEGRRAHCAQTTNRDGHAATSQIKAPDPCYPLYDALWESWDQS